MGGRQQLLSFLSRAAEAGAAVICASSNYEQLSQLCHRVLIFSAGRIVSELRGGDISEEAIAERCYQASVKPGTAQESALQ